MLSTFHVSSRIVANISESSLFSLNSSLGFAGGKHYQKITIIIFRLEANLTISDGFHCMVIFNVFSVQDWESYT